MNLLREIRPSRWARQGDYLLIETLLELVTKEKTALAFSNHFHGPVKLPPEEPAEIKYPEIPPVLGPGEGAQPGCSNPYEVAAPGTDVAALAAGLNWRIG